jgi:hypothetical protein
LALVGAQPSLRVWTSDGSASFVGIERVRRAIHGKTASFLLQDRGTLVGKDVSGQWFVIPGGAPASSGACGATAGSQPSSASTPRSGSTTT